LGRVALAVADGRAAAAWRAKADAGLSKVLEQSPDDARYRAALTALRQAEEK